MQVHPHGRRGDRAGLSRFAAVVLTAVLAGGLLWGLGGAFADDSTPSPAGKVVLRVGWINEPDNLNPFIGYSTSSYLIYHLNYDMLTGYKAANVEPAPELAVSWTHSADGKEWTFKLRPNVKWQDGEAFTADDVVFTYEYIIKHALSAYTSYTVGIERVEKVDDLTVRFVCSRPKSNMLGMWVPIVPEHVWSKVDAQVAQDSYQNKTPIVGTGPFQTVEFKKGQYVRMTANKQYWRGAPTIDEVDFSPYRNADTMVQELRSGALDACWGVPEAQFAPLSADKRFKAIAYVVKGFDELGFNCYTGGKSLGNPVLTDWKFRQALNWAIDKKKLVQIAYSGYAIPADTIIVPNFYSNPDWHWQPPADVACGYDPAKATQMLADAGYKTVNGKLTDKQGKPITLRLFACGAPQQGNKIGKLLVGWFDKIGIDVKFQYMNEGAMNEYLYNMQGSAFVPDFDMYIYNWTGDVDPTFILSIFLTNQINGWSDCAWSDPQYDELFDQQATTIDPKQRQAVIRQMQQILYEQSPYIVLAYPQGLEVVDTSRWEGWVQSPAKGSAIYSVDNIDSYLFVHPRAGAASSSKSRTPQIAALVVLGAVIVVAVILLIVRPRRRRAEEA